MTIKHLVIAGGGPMGLSFLGALQYLNEKSVWNFDDIESIYATSIGTVIGAFICLKYDWEVLNKYIIDRPWNDAFKLTGKQLFEAYSKKGLFDTKFAEIIFSPLLKAKDLSLNITLKEFYEYSHIDFHFYTFELNTFDTVDLSHKTHPDLQLTTALTMSCGLPGIFMPVFMNNGCYMDGGLMWNYPINFCLRDHPNEDEVLGINRCNNDDVINDGNITISEESSILDFIVGFSVNAMNYIAKSVKKSRTKHEVICYSDGKELTLDVIKESVKSSEMRKEWISKGRIFAQNYFDKTVLLS